MFEIKTEQEILKTFKPRITLIKTREKIPDLDPVYLDFLSRFEGTEITPDIGLYGYQESITENKYLLEHYPRTAEALWVIGATGQGDGWFLHRKGGMVLFFDHDQGEQERPEQFVSLEIGFAEFLKMAGLYAELEQLLDQRDLEKAEVLAFKQAVDSISSGLYARYPFDYFK